MLHLTKLAVGVRDIEHLRDLQVERAEKSPPLRHRTRNFPRRHQEVISGGSMYWVVSGTMLVRQRVLDIVEDEWDDGSVCAAWCWIRNWSRCLAGLPNRFRDGAICVRMTRRLICQPGHVPAVWLLCHRHCGANCRYCVSCEICLRDSVKHEDSHIS